MHAHACTAKSLLKELLDKGSSSTLKLYVATINATTDFL